ncbi:unnamed protein product [Heterobilharzia americana]|nr:unnamed protein product [Heterobilharzia americana]
MSGPTDDVIQSTNDDATSSKAYAVSRGYWKDKYIKYFCASPTHKTPEINRGYFVRTTAFRAIAESFVKSTGGVCQIVNLGAGSDTLYFLLKSSQETPKLYVEIDMKANVQYKAVVIERRKLLETAEAKASTQTSVTVNTSQHRFHYVFDGGQFHLLGFDLRRPVQELIDLLCSPVHGINCSQSCPTLFLAECVLVYMPPDTSYQLIKSLSESFPCASFLHYEQVNMSDQFGSIMIKNFRARSCELPGLDACNSLSTQEERFLNAGWKKAKGWTINQVYKALSASTRYRVEHLEMLDDLEVTTQLFDHYCILLATNDETFCPWKQLEEAVATIE